MDINTVFPSTYVKAADLQGGKVIVTIDHVLIEDVGGEQKPVVYFRGKDKGLVLNKTNATAISGIYGVETANWPGGAITLFSTQTEFQGRPCACIRVEMTAPQVPAPPQQAHTAQQQTPAVPPVDEGHDSEEPIPF